jgi:hypothetical protein
MSGQYEAVYSTFDPTVIAFIKSLLIAEKIDFYVDNENASRLRFLGPATVMVVKDQAKQAVDLLKDVDTRM